MQFFMGLDLGQSNDYTALCILEKTTPQGQQAQPIHHCRHLQRFPLGTKYPAIVAAVQTMLATPDLKGKCELVVDASGVGRPVVDMFTQAGLKPVAVTITGGTRANCENGMWSVPKRILVSTLQVLLQGHRLEIVDVPERATLIKEMLAFQVSITEAANDTYGGRTGTHDDLVLAVALAAWKAEMRRYMAYSF